MQKNRQIKMFIYFGKLFSMRAPESEAKDFVLQSVKKLNFQNSPKWVQKKG